MENVENVRAGGVENRRPSDVFLALARYRILGEQSELEEFAGLVETWAQIRGMERAGERGAGERSFAELRMTTRPDQGIRPYAESPSSAAAAAPSPEGEGGEGVSESDTEAPHQPASPAASPQGEAETDVGELEAKLVDSVRPAEVKTPYTGYMSSIKNATRARLMDMRAAGLTSSRLLEAAGGRIRGADLMAILEARPVKLSVYEALAAVLDKIEAQGPPHPPAAPTPSPQGEGRSPSSAAAAAPSPQGEGTGGGDG